MADNELLLDAYKRLREAVAARTAAAAEGDAPVTLPPASAITTAEGALPQPGDADYLQGRGARATLDHILGDVVPALNGQNLSGRYFGFVTGSTLPVAEAADNVVSALDQTVQMHLPDQTVATAVEDAALKMLLSLLGLEAAAWTGRTLTTGATASNVLGLALGREAVVAARGGSGDSSASVAELGLLAACRAAGVRDVRILTSMGHSSLYKAAAVAGLGRAAIRELPLSAGEPWRLDLDAVERELAAGGPEIAHIVVVSAGEVNTGRFATTGRADMQRLRTLADAHGAWIHVDGAFGIFARALPKTVEFAYLHECVDGLELADSITADGHKLLNVPYDTGIFFSRNRAMQSQVFQNPNAAYLAVAANDSSGLQIQSPLNMGIENSRRFRALPVYAALLSEGRDGMAAMFVRMVRLARGIASFLRASAAYQCLPDDDAEQEIVDNKTHIIVLFRAVDEGLNDVLVQKINETRRMYVSGTQWQGQKACRIAVSSWRVDVERDLAVVEDVLTAIASSWSPSP